ncbi:uncharacterized protein [Ptychodera flava]|uniref:uncharacterized protein isoform X2 n=1 Tax=Ptychodera flava TaxID=63121 RepID=UPI00396A7046
MAPKQSEIELECAQIEDRYWTLGRLVCLGYTSNRLKQEMYDPLNLSEVRHEQRRVAALLNSSGTLDIHAYTQRQPVDQLFKNQYHKTFQADGHKASVNLGSWDNSTYEGKDQHDYGRRIPIKKTLQETAYEHLDRLNFPNKAKDATRRGQIAGKKVPVKQKYDVEDVEVKRKNSITRPLGGALQSKQDSQLRETLRISSGDAPYRLPRKTQITRNLEVAIARSRRNKKNVDGRNLKPLSIPTGQSSSERKSSPVAHLKLKHDDIGKGMDLGKRISEAESARLSPLMISPLKTPQHDRVDGKSESSGRGVSAQSTTYGDDDQGPSRSSSSQSSGIGTYRADDEATKESTEEERKKDNDLLRQSTEDTLWFQRHGYTKSAWLRKRMREEAERRRKEAAAADSTKSDTGTGGILKESRKPRQRASNDVYKHANMDAYRQAYLKALAVARSRALPKEPWMLGTRTSRAFTFSYFTHVSTCTCGQCPKQPREPKSKRNEMKMIFGDVKMMDYFKPPPVVKSKRRFNRKSREVHLTAMNSLKEDDEGDARISVKLPPINGNHDNNSELDNAEQISLNDDGGDERRHSNADQNDNLSDSLLSDEDDEKRDIKALASRDIKRVSFKKQDGETSGYDSDSSTET